jgi:Na+/proline symporter
MKLTHIDWLVVAVYMAASLAIGLYHTRRASSSIEEFFVSGRKLPWWLAGTSMVATTFSSDTPLYITGLVRTGGIYENWQWWCFLMTGMLSVVVFARLWKAAGVMTDVELTELRYSGRAAPVLRAVKAVYFALFIHTIIKAQIILAMAKILDVAVGMDKWTAIIMSSAVTITYALLSGYWGVVVTDFFQFIVAMAGAVIIAWAAVDKVGGIAALPVKIDALYGQGNHFLDILPPSEGGLLSLPILTFIAYMGMSWWAKYSSDGGGVIVQRMVSCRNQRHAVGSVLYFNVANYALRTWPWVMAAAASLVLYPKAADNESVYPAMAMELLPTGVRGLVMASFFAAFMSSISTYLNLSSNYVISDVYRRFVKKDAGERHYITATRVSILVLSAVTAVVTYYADSIVGVFKFLIAFGSGTGLCFIMRWYWWRVNAWSEISAMAASTVVSSAIYLIWPKMPYYDKLLLIILFSNVVWVVVTLLTRPVDERVLINFYGRLRVGGIGWRPVEEKIRAAGGGADITPRGHMRTSMLNWLYGCVFVYGLTVGLGLPLLNRPLEGALWLLAGLAGGLLFLRSFKGWD